MKKEKNSDSKYTQNIVSDFASLLFSDVIIREYIGEKFFSEFINVRSGKAELSRELLFKMSSALRNWALKMGATHYMHWFQPLTMHVAGKQNSLIKLSRDNAIYDLSAEDLLFGEGDASSLPSGGLRSTFEARGVLEWDITSFAFIKEYKGGRVLYIPTKFTTFNNQSLDLKSPLLASIKATKENVVPLINLINKALDKNEIESVNSMVGPEQEFFLIDREYYNKRPDLYLSGKTVLGSIGTIGEYSVEHYYGGLSERIQAFFQALNKALYKMGIVPSTQHREAAPNQFEIALHYDECNIICDKNLIVQEVMKDVARHFGLEVLFAEKPFDGVNGSGKHTNWSINTSLGENIFSTDGSLGGNIRFLFFLTIFIMAVDEYCDLLRCSVASYSNDLRLSKQEAPPCIISVYLGEELEKILSSKGNEIRNAKIFSKTGINSDRNRTSPIAFTGNKFEFRLTGSNQSVSTVCTFINFAFSSACKKAYNELKDKDITVEFLCDYISRKYAEHSRIVYNENCYADKWVTIAKERGLEKLDTTLQCIPTLTKDKNIKALSDLHIFTESELKSRQNVMTSSYIKEVKQDATVLAEMIRKSILPVMRDEILKNSQLAEIISKSNKNFDKLKDDYMVLDEYVSELEVLISSFENIDEFNLDNALKIQKEILPSMSKIRKIVDQVESSVDKRYWPFPSYDDLLYKI